MNDTISNTFGALADPTRRAMLAQLALGTLTVSELAAPYKISLAAASKHISVLQSAGLLSKQKRGRAVICRLNPEPLKTVASWVSRYERFWDEQLDALQDFLADADETELERT